MVFRKKALRIDVSSKSNKARKQKNRHFTFSLQRNSDADTPFLQMNGSNTMSTIEWIRGWS